MSGTSLMEKQPVPAGDGGSIPTVPLQKHEWIVSDCPIDVAAELVREHHYAIGAANTRTYLHGLYPRFWSWYAECVGAAWWIPPTRSAAEAWAGDRWQGVLSLSRLVIAPETPKNAASFLISHSVASIDRERWPVLVTYADEWQGHTGSIYSAAGWRFCGYTAPEATFTINGVMTARKAGGRTRTHKQMAELGAKLEGRFRRSRWRAP